MVTINLILLFVFLLLLPVRSWAVNFFDGAKPPDGKYFLTYSSYYYADTLAGSDGSAAKKDYRYGRFEELFRLCWYKGGGVLTAFFPAGNAHSGYYGASSGGLGDINLGAGWFLPVKQADILPSLFVKFPTGEYDRDKTVNYGSNQYDIKPMVFLYKQAGKFSVDAVAKYYFRLRNPATRVSPGDELHLQCLLGWQFSRWGKAGPSVNWYKSKNQELRGRSIAGSRRECLSAGADVYFRTPFAGITLTWMTDVESKNTTKGQFFQIKTVQKF